jgi:tetratricopeptide (TPR) repeat protein
MLASSSAGRTPVLIVNPDELLAAAMSCHARGDNSKAESIYRTILTAEPSYLSALNNLALLLSRRSLHQEAAELLSKAVSIRSDYADAHYNLGNAFLGLQQTEAAIDAFTTALKCDPAFAAAHLGLAAIYGFRGQLDATLRHYEEAIRCNPSLPDAYLGMGAAYQSKGDLSSARLSYVRAAACAPHMTSALAKIASLAPMGPAVVLPEAIAEIELCLRAGEMRAAI